MTKHLMFIPGVLAVLILSGLCCAAEPLSEETLDQITARGQAAGPREPSPIAPTSTVSAHNVSPTGLIIHSQSQTHLRGGTVNNVAGRNQVANGINVR